MKQAFYIVEFNIFFNSDSYILYNLKFRVNQTHSNIAWALKTFNLVLLSIYFHANDLKLSTWIGSPLNFVLTFLYFQ